MQKIKQENEEISQLPPNFNGIPCKNETSEELRREHNRWKRESKIIHKKAATALKYWEKMSACTTL